ncbi:unnamed protein product [Sphagnum troendelagicum]|uniref:Phosphotransferase n=1 Tax=Sphagnum troendelagicum TaxID=128251 RepID=A0ABP0UIB2_9BRYO
MAIGGALGCMSMSYGNTTVCVKSAVVVRSRRVPQWRAQSIAQQKSKSNQTAQILLSEFRQASATPLQRLRQVSDDMTAEMHAGLLSEGGSQQLKMLPTYVEHLPTGDEEGLFYAVDLGGTNFRVLRVQLGGKEKRIMNQEYQEVAIPPELMLGTSKELFDFIAKTLADFVATEGEGFDAHSGHIRELGFAFSFPVLQTSVKSGIVIHWTKGFKIDDAVGKDIVAAFEEAIGRKGDHIRVAALVNDTVGTLARGRFWNEDTMLGVILGTGTNACYVERADAVAKWRDPPPKSGEMIINLEWGNFRSPHLPRTFADEEVDVESVNPGDQWFEKMVGGMYLGEIVRRVLAKIAQEAGLFGGSSSPKLFEPFSLSTPYVSKMHSDESAELTEVAKILEDVFEIQSTTFQERKIVHDVCDILAERGARLAAAGIVGILKKIGRDGSTTNGSQGLKNSNGKTVVAMDGGLYEHYAQFRAYMQAAIEEMLSETAAKSVVLELSKDGSGIGTALLAASHSQYGTVF